MDRKVLILLGVVLALLVVKLVFFLGNKNDTVEYPDTLAFQCLDCEHDWDMPEPEARPWFAGGMANDSQLVPCASCDKKKALLKRNCLWCGERYVPSLDVLRANTIATPQTSYAKPPSLKPEICPHCNQDVLKWKPPR